MLSKNLILKKLKLLSLPPLPLEPLKPLLMQKAKLKAITESKSSIIAYKLSTDYRMAYLSSKSKKLKQPSQKI
jgi:hypothetical protein